VQILVHTLRGTADPVRHDVARRAALALAYAGDGTGIPELVNLIEDAEANEESRRRAIEAVGVLRAKGAVDALVKLLEQKNDRLYTLAVEVLGQIGDRRAARPLLLAFEKERYLPARTAEAWALVKLKHPRTAALVRRFLGVETPMPDGVAILQQLGVLNPPSARGADVLQAETVRKGTWSCNTAACSPEQDASIVLPPGPPAGSVRAVVRVVSNRDGERLRINDSEFVLRKGAQEVSLALAPAVGARALRFEPRGQIGVVALAVVPITEEIPPPAPEPWDAGVRGRASTDAGVVAPDAGAADSAPTTVDP
jgi:hypothetical protein